MSFSARLSCDNPGPDAIDGVRVFDGNLPNDEGPRRSLQLPARWAHKDFNWWRAMVMSYIMRPNAELDDKFLVSEARNAFPEGIPRPYASIFVRGGDKEGETTLFDPHAYVNLLEKYASQLGVRNVYVNSDSQQMVNETVALLHAAGFRTYVLPMERGYWFSKLDTPESTQDVGVLARTSILDLHVQLAGDFFFGITGSNWIRLVDVLRMARGKLLMPFFFILTEMLSWTCESQKKAFVFFAQLLVLE